MFRVGMDSGYASDSGFISKVESGSANAKMKFYILLQTDCHILFNVNNIDDIRLKNKFSIILKPENWKPSDLV
jgi:hypothetical protein